MFFHLSLFCTLKEKKVKNNSLEGKEQFINNGVTNKQSTFLFYKIPLRYFFFRAKCKSEYFLKIVGTLGTLLSLGVLNIRNTG